MVIRPRFYQPVGIIITSDQGGLALDVAEDSSTIHALQLALPQLLEEELS